MHKFLLLCSFCAALAACSAEPTKPDPAVASTCQVSSTGSNIATRGRCTTTTTSDNSEARDQAEMLRAQQSRMMNAAMARP
jgi:hypothetical protein